MKNEKPNVFIVDDEPSVGKAIGRLLKSMGYKYKCYTSAEAFLEGADMEQVDCLILDIMLPGMDGLELQQELKKRECSIPIIFITGHGEKQLEREVMNAGALGYLNKPFDEQVLINLIDLVNKTETVC